MILRSIAVVRSWPASVRIGIATTAGVAATAAQLPADIEVPSEPFLLNFVVVVASTCLLGRAPGVVTVAESTVASLLSFEPLYAFQTDPCGPPACNNGSWAIGRPKRRGVLSAGR
jgi:hypothetical protein